MRAFTLLAGLMAGSALAQDVVTPEPVPFEVHGPELGLHGGFMWTHHYDGGDHSGAGARLHLLVLLGRHVAVGPEVALYSHAGSYGYVKQDEVVEEHDASLFQLGGLVRIGWPLGPVSPSLLLGAGWYKGLSAGAGASAGVGLDVRFAKQWSVGLFARYHVFHYVGPELGLGVHWSG